MKNGRAFKQPQRLRLRQIKIRLVGYKDSKVDQNCQEDRPLRLKEEEAKVLAKRIVIGTGGEAFTWCILAASSRSLTALLALVRGKA